MQTKTPVEIIQELIAIHTTRKEAADRLNAEQLTDAAAQQSDEFIAEWMTELSNYGDAVMATADRENEYQEIWKSTLGTIDAISPQKAAQTFHAMESALKNIYQQIMEANSDLPVSVLEILKRQLSKL